MLLCFQFSLLKLPHSCGAFIHIYDGTHSPDRNNLFLRIHYWNYIQLWNFPSYFWACYSDACAFSLFRLLSRGNSSTCLLCKPGFMPAIRINSINTNIHMFIYDYLCQRLYFDQNEHLISLGIDSSLNCKRIFVGLPLVCFLLPHISLNWKIGEVIFHWLHHFTPFYAVKLYINLRK